MFITAMPGACASLCNERMPFRRLHQKLSVTWRRCVASQQLDVSNERARLDHRLDRALLPFDADFPAFHPSAPGLLFARRLRWRPGSRERESRDHQRGEQHHREQGRSKKGSSPPTSVAPASGVNVRINPHAAVHRHTAPKRRTPSKFLSTPSLNRESAIPRSERPERRKHSTALRVARVEPSHQNESVAG